jgi:hypothetical protein
MRRGTGGGGRGVSVGSGEGVRDREKRLDRLGRSAREGIEREKCGLCLGSSGSGAGGGAGAKLMTNADSARSAWPKL